MLARAIVLLALVPAGGVRLLDHRPAGARSRAPHEHAKSGRVDEGRKRARRQVRNAPAAMRTRGSRP